MPDSDIINTGIPDIVGDFLKKTHNFFVSRPQPVDYVVSFFQRAENLFFIDVGSHDGIEWSNSFVLEKYLNWEGICLEPQEDQFKKLVENRGCICLNSGIYNESGERIFRKVDGYANMLSGFLDSFTDKHIKRIESEIKKFGGSYSDTLIKTETLDEIIKEKNIKFVDYLSIDCECAEYEILKSMNFEFIKPSLISIEFDGDRISDEKCVELLKGAGYSVGPKVGGDLFFFNI